MRSSSQAASKKTATSSGDSTVSAPALRETAGAGAGAATEITEAGTAIATRVAGEEAALRIASLLTIATTRLTQLGGLSPGRAP